MLRKVLLPLGVCSSLALALSSAKLDDAAQIQVESKESHWVQLIDSNRLALKERFEQIEQATSSITMETYYFFPDEGGNVLLKALVDKKRKSPWVRIRLLFDSWASTGLSQADADYLKRNGIEVRWFVGDRIFSLGPQRHNHRKSWIFDNKSALIGGYNHASEHMGLSALYNMVDREILIEGPIVGSIQKSYDLIWNAAAQTNPEKLSQESHVPDIERLDIASYFESVRDEPVRFRKLKIDQIGYFAETKKQFELFPFLQKKIDQFFSSSQHRISIESRYFIPTSSTFLTLFRKIRNGIPVQILTNGDRAVLPYESHFLQIAKLSLTPIEWIGAKVRRLSGESLNPEQSVNQESLHSLWGTHSKTYVSDSKTLIGSYNLDPASEYLNLEHFLILTSEDLADQAVQSIADRRGF